MPSNPYLRFAAGRGDPAKRQFKRTNVTAALQEHDHDPCGCLDAVDDLHA
jgi:hypothetical protein